MVGVFVLLLGICAVWCGITAHTFYFKSMGSPNRRIAPKWPSRLMFVGIGSFFVWRGFQILRDAIGSWPR